MNSSSHTRASAAAGRQGMTLIEMLIVVAIIAIMAGVALPTLARLGAFSRDDVYQSTRSVFAALRAARQYAATNNVDAAVIYVQDPAIVLPTGDYAVVGLGIAARNKAMEQDAFFPPEDVFQMIEAPESELRRLTDNTMMHVAAIGYVYAGMKPVYLYQTPDDAGVPGFPIEETYIPDGDVRFLAHVFTPRGELQTRGAVRERFKLYVNYVPGLVEEDERTAAERRIDLYRGTGRAHVVTEEDVNIDEAYTP